MIRLKKFQEPRMVSARVEKADFDKLIEALRKQKYLTLQDFIVFAFKLFIDGKIVLAEKDFQLKDSHDPE